MNISDDIKLYQINDNGKLILAIDFNKYNELLNKYNNMENELKLTINVKDQKENLLREYEHKLKDKKEIEKKYDQLELNMSLNLKDLKERCTEAEMKIEEIRKICTYKSNGPKNILLMNK